MHARIKAATSTILVDVFDLDPDVLEDLNERSNRNFQTALRRVTTQEEPFGPVDLAELEATPYRSFADEHKEP